MSQKRITIRLPEHCEMLRAIKLHFEEANINLSRYSNDLIKYYLITGKFYEAGNINPEKYHERINEPTTLALYIDTNDSDMVLKNWLENHTSRELAKQIRLILNNSFSIGDNNNIKPYEILYNDCELLTMECKQNKTHPSLPPNERLDKLISILEKINPEELDKLLDMLSEKTENTTNQDEHINTEPTAQEKEDAALERTQKMLSNLNSLL